MSAAFDIMAGLPAHMQPGSAPAIPAGDSFSFQAIVDAKDIRVHNHMTIFVRIFITSMGRDDLVGVDFADWESSDYARFGAVIGALGSNSLMSAKTGTINWDGVKAMEAYPLESLKAALVNPARVVSTMLTDLTLVQHIIQFRGVVVRAEDDIAEVSVPGVASTLKVHFKGPCLGRVQAHGDVFVAQMNAAYGTTVKYTSVSSTARILAFYLLCRREVSIDIPGNHLVSQTVPNSTKDIRTMIPYRIIDADEQWLRKFVTEAFKNVDNRPSVGSKSEKLTYIELLLHNAISKGNASDKASASHAASAAKAAFDDAFSKMKTNLGQLYKDSGMVELSYVSKFIKGDVMVGGMRMATQGIVATFVSESRNVIRDQFDMARKSDAPGIACVGGSITSVPSKISGALSVLSSMRQGLDGEAHAFGTGSDSRWQAQLESQWKGKLSYFDVNPAFVPHDNAVFEKRDVTALSAGYGIGKTIIDDTWNGPDDKLFDADFIPKIRSVVLAGYDSGILKVAMGLGGDSAAPFHRVPVSTNILLEAGYTVEYATGSGPHSLEYFIVFNKFASTVEWEHPSVNVDNSGMSPGKMAANNANVDQTIWEKYVRAWMTIKAVEVIASNSLLNLQLVSGYNSGDKVNSLLEPSVGGRSQELRLAGRKELAVASTVDVVPHAAPDSANIYNMGF